ncbi:DNA-binding response regulator [Antrihabitans sp. YC3-6]|uniref:DNA-binding response regulator n=1 Tax=Antrihabitans stalagmiti TaxID=2799499 RepID=A0A934U3Y3_9NOCA|nr:helix-turn-helix transcriptional regulator [Antrihabitans stalagmiti]MBJ8339946.1 DNA-binding response regulator [Antrihabitans stalagmiti]
MVEIVDQTPPDRALVDKPLDVHAVGDWQATYDWFVAGKTNGELSGADLVALAEAAWWLGKIDESLDAFTRAHRIFVDVGQTADAAMAAFYLGLHTGLRGDVSKGAGWMRRCYHLLDEIPECAAHGFPLYLETAQALGRGDTDTAMASATRMHTLGRTLANTDLVAVGVLCEGKTLVALGQLDEGLALLDEAMLMVSTGEVTPFWSGAIYCHVMSVCHELTDLRRASEVTKSATQWCSPLPDANLYPGICRVHRAQVLQLHGSWDDAMTEALRAHADTVNVNSGVASDARYEVAEILRLRGDLAGAEESLRAAHELGADPQPGLALIRLAQGNTEAAASSIRTALADEHLSRSARSRLHLAQLEIAFAAGDLDTARRASAALTEAAQTHSGSGLAAAATRARGAVLLAEGKAVTALPVLRTACRQWQQLEAPYETARTRLLLAETYRGLGDDDAVALELDAAATVFERLGALPDIQRVAALRGASTAPGGLSTREIEVLRLIAAGNSNREIATALFLSERTVHRHVANVFTKLGVTSRSAATAYAFENGIVDPRRR